LVQADQSKQRNARQVYEINRKIAQARLIDVGMIVIQI
jgi:hypothetical protein